MRPADLKRLEQPYSESDSTNPSERISQALAVHLPSVSVLIDEVRSDLDPTTYGVQWWKDYRALGTQRRILISDQLLLCINSLELNLREAKLHLLEASHNFDDRTREMVAATRFNFLDLPYQDFQQSMRAADDLAAEFARLHIIGVVRAVASALDCLAAAIIGVAAFEQPILRAGFLALLGDTLHKLVRSGRSPQTPGERLQRDLAQRIVETVNSAGPQGWLEWALDYRNMLVHRGRLLEVHKVRPTGEWSVSPRMWRPFRLPVSVTLLPRDPGRSEIESLRDMLGLTLLDEPAEATLSNLLKATLQVVGTTCEILTEAWRTRRQSPGMLIQPVKQWPTPLVPRSSVFRGFHPDERPPKEDNTMMVSPVLLTRLRAAALQGGTLDDNISRWNSFD